MVWFGIPVVKGWGDKKEVKKDWVGNVKGGN